MPDFKDDIDREIYEIGKEILSSDILAKGGNQTHHKRSTVLNHTLSVTRKSVHLCNFIENLTGKKVDRESVILGALCHDLGIIGRDEKYSGNLECYVSHPSDSVKEAEKLIPNMSDKLRAIIEHHMWPLTKKQPSTIEEVIVIMADKVATFTDIGDRVTKG